MIAFVLRRLLQAVVVMLVVGFIAFALFNFVGDPVALMLPPEATQADRDAMRTMLGLDRPFWAQFATFLTNALQGNFGISLRLGRPVSDLLVERLPATLELAFTAALMASSRVAGRRSTSSVETGRPSLSEMPKLPCSALCTKVTNCW